MEELIIYTGLLLALLAHSTAASKMYKTVNSDQDLSFKEKNDWKLKALVFPVFFWRLYQKEKKKPN